MSTMFTFLDNDNGTITIMGTIVAHGTQDRTGVQTQKSINMFARRVNTRVTTRSELTA